MSSPQNQPPLPENQPPLQENQPENQPPPPPVVDENQPPPPLPVIHPSVVLLDSIIREERAIPLQYLPRRLYSFLRLPHGHTQESIGRASAEFDRLLRLRLNEIHLYAFVLDDFQILTLMRELGWKNIVMLVPRLSNRLGNPNWEPLSRLLIQNGFHIGEYDRPVRLSGQQPPFDPLSFADAFAGPGPSHPVASGIGLKRSYSLVHGDFILVPDYPAARPRLSAPAPAPDVTASTNHFMMSGLSHTLGGLSSSHGEHSRPTVSFALPQSFGMATPLGGHNFGTGFALSQSGDMPTSLAPSFSFRPPSTTPAFVTTSTASAGATTPGFGYSALQTFPSDPFTAIGSSHSVFAGPSHSLPGEASYHGGSLLDTIAHRPTTGWRAGQGAWTQSTGFAISLPVDVTSGVLPTSAVLQDPLLAVPQDPLLAVPQDAAPDAQQDLSSQEFSVSEYLLSGDDH